MKKTHQQSSLKSTKLKECTLIVISFCFAFVAGPKAVEAATLTTVARNLDNPRGLAFGLDGALYVAEAGRGGEGPSIQGPELGANLFYGETGAITRIQNGIQERVVTGLPSLRLVNDPNSGLPTVQNDRVEALGPQGIGFSEDGEAYLAIGYGSNPAFKSNLGSFGADLGKLIAFDLNADGSWQRRADFAADFVTYERLNNPDGQDQISNPYALNVQGDNVFVVDSGANDLFRVNKNTGSISLESVFDNSRSINGIPYQSVPTSIALGPDGAFYVGEYTGFPFPEGGARIYRVVPGYEPEIYADGFTQITGLAFDPQGNLNVLEYAAQSQASTSDIKGVLIQLSPDGTRRTLVGENEGLIGPTALTVGPDGAIYVSNFGSFAGKGQVVRIEDTTSVPEPSVLLGVLAFGTLGAISILKGKHKLVVTVHSPKGDHTHRQLQMRGEQMPLRP